MQIKLQSTPSPVKSLYYKRTLSNIDMVPNSAALSFLMQWHAFSESMPDLLAQLILKASSETERINLVKNLSSELGIDDGTPSHPKLLQDLIESAFGRFEPSLVMTSTKQFIHRIHNLVATHDAAYNAGLVLALEEVAYDILDVLKEVLLKAGHSHLIKHAYITIHERVEAEHIANTESTVECYLDQYVNVEDGYCEMMSWWHEFWRHAYSYFEAHNA